jgi:hypothetical protein
MTDSSGTSKHGDRYLIVKSSVGSGLGDRIRAVLSAILYAQRSGRNLNVIWDDGLYGNEGENVFPHLFELRGVAEKSFPLPTDMNVFPPLWRELHQPMHVLYEHYIPEGWNRLKALSHFSFDQSRLDYPNDVLVMWDFDQFGVCCDPPVTWDDHLLVGELAKRHLAPAESVSQAVNAYRARYFRPEMIGVHIRLSNEAQCRTKSVEESHYHTLIRRIRRRYPETGIFLATDNIEVERRFGHRYGELLVTTEKWFGEAGDPLHLSKRRGDRFQNAVEALTDMFLLASCSHLIFPALSSFSLMASLLSSAANGNITRITDYGGIRGYFRKLLYRIYW